MPDWSGLIGLLGRVLTWAMSGYLASWSGMTVATWAIPVATVDY